MRRRASKPKKRCLLGLGTCLFLAVGLMGVYNFVKQHSDASGQPVRLHPEGVEALSCSDPRVWDGSSQQAMLAAAKDVMVACLPARPRETHVSYI